jgi:hypothetical protein
MTVALWIVGGFVFVVCFGTLALRLAIWLIEITLVVGGWLITALFGLACTLWLAVAYPSELRRIWRNEATKTRVRLTLTRERWT